MVATIRNRLRGTIVVEPRVSVHVGLTAGIATTSHVLAISADDLVAAAEDALQQADTFSTGILVLDDGVQGSRERTAIIRMVKDEFALSHRISRLQTMQQLFKYWHVAHLPFALIMLIVLVIHVGVTLAFGYRWIF